MRAILLELAIMLLRMCLEKESKMKGFNLYGLLMSLGLIVGVAAYPTGQAVNSYVNAPPQPASKLAEQVIDSLQAEKDWILSADGEDVINTKANLRVRVINHTISGGALTPVGNSTTVHGYSWNDRNLILEAAKPLHEKLLTERLAPNPPVEKVKAPVAKTE